MNVLAIDTSVGVSVAILRSNGEVTQSKAVDHGMQGELTAELISKVVSDSGLKIEEITDLVVGVGPGPFTGLRVGLVTASVFAHAREIPIHGICSLDAIAIDQSEYTVAIDARRKEIYWARYKDGVRIEGPAVSKPAEVDRFIIDHYPDMKKLVSLATSQNITEPMYLRRPDAVPTAERT